MKRPQRYPIASFHQLASALRPGRRLTKTCRPRGPLYEIQGKLCDPTVASEAIARGWLHPIDAGLFGSATAQSWELREFNNDY
jgi:hypothetical protein